MESSPYKFEKGVLYKYIKNVQTASQGCIGRLTHMNPNTIAKSAPKNNSTLKITGAEAIIRCLLEEGVDLIYGYPGGAIMPVYDELYKFQDQIQHTDPPRAGCNPRCGLCPNLG